MSIGNHLLAGALIVMAIKNPYVALPLALLSHFALDALPHYGYNRKGFDTWLRHRLSFFVTAADFVAVILVLAVIISNSYWMALFGGLLAVTPDVVWVYHYIKYERKNLTARYGLLSRLHISIQWCERPWGFVVEFFVFVAMFYALLTFI